MEPCPRSLSEGGERPSFCFWSVSDVETQAAAHVGLLALRRAFDGTSAIHFTDTQEERVRDEVAEYPRYLREQGALEDFLSIAAVASEIRNDYTVYVHPCPRRFLERSPSIISACRSSAWAICSPIIIQDRTSPFAFRRAAGNILRVLQFWGGSGAARRRCSPSFPCWQPNTCTGSGREG